VKPKREMTRMVRAVDGSVHRDETGREPGRGTYICNEPTCNDEERGAAAIRRALGVVPAMDGATRATT